jgi:hypothetical protein
LTEMAAEAPQITIHGQEGPVPWVFGTKFLDGKFIGEDYTFCDSYVAKYKKPIPVWANFDFEHSGYKGNLYEWLEREVEKKKLADAAA